MAKASYVAGFVLAALFFIGGIQLCACRNSTSGACIQRERNALLKFKASLQDPSNLLSSWEGQDCCRWKGVSCDQNTGHVIKLHLRKSNSDWLCWMYARVVPNYSDKLGLGKVDLSLTELKHLKYLDLSGNNFQASEIPKFFGSLNKLRYLNLSCTYFTGKVPHQLGNLTNLQVLDLKSDPYSDFVQGAYADDFQWSSSLLSLQHLDMSGVDLGSAHNWMELDLSRNMLHGQIPHCWADSLRIAYIDLSSNQLSGTIPGSLCNHPLRWLYVNNNSLSGTLPLALRNCTQLRSMNLGENRLSGVIPTWIGENYLYLQILRLRENTFTGSIPLSLCRLSYLRILDTACNHLIGRIPLCFNNLSGMTTTRNSEESAILSSILYEELTQVMKGQSLKYTNGILQLVVNMDLSSNNLVGCIPQQLTTLDGLLGLNLSHNHLSGSIPQQIGNMKALFSLDFSDNQISGPIPNSMSILTFLSYLNLSYNNLSGKIPKGNQLQTLTDPAIYAGNQLCGDPLPKCASDGEQVQPPIRTGAEDAEQGESKSEKFWFYFVVSCGYATGLSGVFWILMVKKNWRTAYFRYADKGQDWVLEMVAVQVARLKRKMEGNNNGTE